MIEATWKRIEAWLAANAPPVLASLQAGASAEEIGQLERVLGVTLPDDVKASYRIHDGQGEGSAGLTEEGDLLPLAQIARAWSSWQQLAVAGSFDMAESQPSGPIKTQWWNLRWIPFTHDGSGNHLCLDLDPAPGGTPGQVITMWHDDARRKIVAASFSLWLAHFADQLEAGDYAYSESDGGWGRVVQG